MGTVIDLSHPVADGTITYPGLPGPVITDHLSRAESRERYAPGYEFQIGRIDMVSNTGTYLDTPFHRFPDGYDLSGLDLARVAGVPGLVVDATGSPEAAAELLDGLDVAGRAVLFRTGWDRHWGSEAYGDPAHPYVAVTAAARLIEGGAAVVGIDSVNIDDTRTGERPVHTALLGAGIPIVEHLRGLDALVGRAFAFFAVPPAIVGMGTFPVRAPRAPRVIRPVPARVVGRRLVVGTVVVLQLLFVARGYWSDHKEFAFQMFPESSTWEADIVRVTADGRRVPISEGWAGYRWSSMVTGRGLSNPGTRHHADAGLDNQLAFLDAALDYVATHTPRDRETRYLEAVVTTWHNDDQPTTVVLRSVERP